MRIVIDMQGAQTKSRFRGIGRYTMEFAQAIARNSGEHEIILALSGLFPETIEPIRAAFEGILAQENIRIWQAPRPVCEQDTGNDVRRETAEQVREAFLAHLRPDVIHISSLFEGYVDDAVTSIGRFDFDTPVSVMIYDLIPLLNASLYLEPNPVYEQYYLRKVEWLKHSAVCLAISDYTRAEVFTALDLGEGRVVNVSTAIDGHFQPQPVDVIAADQLKQKFGISRPFVLHTGGMDERKNLRRLIEAWSRLPKKLRQTHQLLFVGQRDEAQINNLRQIASEQGLATDELFFGGYVTDEVLVQLYNLCQLFVFPSWHEGFGLPVLEAMACGAPVIGANTTSVPEVIGLDEALFDPFDVAAISKKIGQALIDQDFRARLREHGLQQAKKFSWNEVAKSSIQSWEQLILKRQEGNSSKFPSITKPRLAFVSPLPPERTGIADFSAELLPALAAHYDIELVVAQEKIDEGLVRDFGSLRDVAWLRSHAAEIDRVVYQVGNSPFHAHMVDLIQEVPGIVVLHDFYLSGLMWWLENHGGETHAWPKALYESHGYGALGEHFRRAGTAEWDFCVNAYPANFGVLQHAKGVIVHSEQSRRMAVQFYGAKAETEWKVIPLLRSPAGMQDKRAARHQLGIDENDFVVCSFGFLGPTKLNHRLLQAWLDSALATNNRCRLIFVGENHGGEYGTSLLKKINDSGFGDRLCITGFASPDLFRKYLVAADLSVQLRTLSRGETSAAVLDSMNYGLPLIVNANGSMAELDAEAVWMLPDEFDNAALIEALEVLWRDPVRRQSLGAYARGIIREHHSPEKCANQYATAIEYFYRCSATSMSALIKAIAASKDFTPDEPGLIQLSSALAVTLPLPKPAHRLFLDVTATCRNDLKTGIERVARALVVTMLESPPAGYRIEPVYLSDVGGKWHHCNAHSYTLGLMGCPSEILDEAPIEFENGDILLVADISGDALIQAVQAGLFNTYHNFGVQVYSVVYDLLPIRMPDVFPPGASETFTKWIQSISTFDGAICISKAVADDLALWRLESEIDWQYRRPFHIGWWHLGADVINSAPSMGMPAHAEKVLAQLSSRPSFLMVGTIEPRKGYLQTLEAFTRLWEENVDVNLVIVGKEGWKGLADEMRRNIPQTIQFLRSHPELHKRLYWLEGISDEYLEKVYAASTCLVAASYGEGFGLPLIEAAQYNLPIIARDIPVFREVANVHAFYFKGEEPVDLLQAIKSWLQLFENGSAPESIAMPYFTWKESAARLAGVLIEKKQFDLAIDIEKQAIDKHLILIHRARVRLVRTQLPEGDVILDLGGANCPLYKMGYPNEFKKLYLIDLPPEDRCDMYKEIVIDPNCDGGEVVIQYGDMTKLDFFGDSSVDFVWSGQSIEHLPIDAGRRMCEAAYRVLKPGGAFCLDTPNRIITKIHTRDIGGGFIHPEHYIEYEPSQLRTQLEAVGFVINNVLGVCQMPNTYKNNKFDYTDFLMGDQISNDVDQSYIQYFHCIKPVQMGNTRYDNDFGD